MATFPASGAFDVPATPSDFTATDFATAQEAFLSATKQIPGGDTYTTLAIASGVIVPTTGSHIIDTEGDASADDLTTIQYTNVRDGALLVLWPEDGTNHVITIKHLAGGIGQIHLCDHSDYVMSAHACIVFQRQGSVWYEVCRGNSMDTTASRLTNLEWFVRALCGDADGVFAFGVSGTDSLLVAATDPESMVVAILDGAAIVNGTPFRLSSNTSLTLIAPSSNDRIDAIVANIQSGNIESLTGVENASPVCPTVPSHMLKIAEVYHVAGESAIYNSATSGEGYITDSRIFINM